MKQTNKIKAFLTVLATTTALSSGFALTWEELSVEQRKDIIKSAYGPNYPADKKGFLTNEANTLGKFKERIESKLDLENLTFEDFRTILQGLDYGKEKAQKNKMQKYFTGKADVNMKALEAYLRGKAPAADAALGIEEPKENPSPEENIQESGQHSEHENLSEDASSVVSEAEPEQKESSSEASQKQAPTSTPAKENPIAKAYREAAERKKAADSAKTQPKATAPAPAPTSTPANENPIAKAYREAAERKKAADLAKAKPKATAPAPTPPSTNENPIAKAYREAAERKQATDLAKANQASNPATTSIQANDPAANAKKAAVETKFNNVMHWIGESSEEELKKYQLSDLVGNIKSETQTEMSLQDIEKYAREFITRYDESAAKIAKKSPEEQSKLQNTYLGAQRLLERLKEQKQKEEQKQVASESESEEDQESFSN
ncbi:MAG: hypothetical protein ACRCYP_05600 [Alphaproteobacteria bacterium]